MREKNLVLRSMIAHIPKKKYFHWVINSTSLKVLFNFLYSVFGVNAKIGDLGNRIFKDLRIQDKSSFLSTSTFINSKKLSSNVRLLPLT